MRGIQLVSCHRQAFCCVAVRHAAVQVLFSFSPASRVEGGAQNPEDAPETCQFQRYQFRDFAIRLTEESHFAIVRFNNTRGLINLVGITTSSRDSLRHLDRLSFMGAFRSIMVTIFTVTRRSSIRWSRLLDIHISLDLLLQLLFQAFESSFKLFNIRSANQPVSSQTSQAMDDRRIPA